MNEAVEKKIGEVKIADEVLKVIAGLAATDVKGVYALGGDITRDYIIQSGEKLLSKAVRVSVNSDGGSVRLALVLDGTVSIPTVQKNVVDKVRYSLESMTGIPIKNIQITICGVHLV